MSTERDHRGADNVTSVADEGRTPTPITVRRDQCRGIDLRCANCSEPLGGRHHFLCYAYAIARKEARREG